MDGETMDISSATAMNIVLNVGLDPKYTKDATFSGSSSPLRSVEKVQSRYLSPHMASCHDYCKHGKKHDSEAQTMRLNFRKFVKRNSTPDGKQDHVTSPNLGERKRRIAKKPKSTTKMETDFSDKIEVPNPQTPPPSVKDCFATDEKKTIQISPDNEQSKVKSLIPGDGDHVISPNLGERKRRTAKKPKAPTKMETDFSNIIEVPNPQTPSPSVKICFATDEKKTIQISPDNEQSELKSLIPGDGEKEKAIKHGTPLQTKLSPIEPNSIKLNDSLSPDSDMNATRESNIINKKKTAQPSAKKSISSVAPKVIEQKAPTSPTKSGSIRHKVPLPPKRVDVAGKVAITLKTKTPLLIRSLSQLKSSRSSIAQRRNKEETDIGRSLGATKIGERKLWRPPRAPLSSKSSWNLIAQRDQDNNKMDEGLQSASKIGERKLLLKPTTASSSSFSKASHDNASNLQLRNLKPTMKRTSLTPHDNVSNLQLRKLKRTKSTSTPQDNGSNLQLRKLRSTERTSSTPRDNGSNFKSRKPRSTKQTSAMPHDTVSNLQPRKLGSMKHLSATHDENVSSLHQRKLRENVKQTSIPHHIVSSTLQSRKLRKVNRASSMKDRDKPDTESNSGNIDLDPDQKEEESESSISRVSDEETEGNDTIGVKKDENKRRWQRTATARAEDNNTPTPFKLKFRKGKVINLRSDSIGARRLWFNLGMMGTENPSGNGLLWRKRSFRRKRDIDSLDSNTPSSEVHSVVLKHQGVSEKKDGQSLFNHVIEETASKLAETRKSKVKALVGAFETVISLQ